MLEHHILQMATRVMDRSAQLYNRVVVPTIVIYDYEKQQRIDLGLARAKAMLELIYGIEPISTEAVSEYEDLMKRVMKGS